MSLPNPITRKEQYLAKAAGESVSIPEEPLTREEMYLEKIAEGGGGGGGGTTVIANPSGEATDDLTKIQIGNTVYGIEGGGGSGSLPDYSTTEQKTGQKWIDGKPIYQKTFVFDDISGTVYTSSQLDLDIETVTDLYAWVKLGSQGGNQWITAPYIEDQYYRCDCHYQSGDDKIYVKSSWSATDAIVTLKYTKTTDTSS